jgi:hypothetical protein
MTLMTGLLSVLPIKLFPPNKKAATPRKKYLHYKLDR